MKGKYFIRGLGTGILITAVVLGLSYRSKYSDENIIMEARKLGMDFPDINGITHPSESPAVSAGPEESDAPAQSSGPADDSVKEPDAEPDTETDTEPEDTISEPSSPPEDDGSGIITPTPENEAAPDVVTGQEDETLIQPQDVVPFTIERGDWSRIVSERLESLGVIDNAREFDEYLVNNGYAGRIKVGNFEARKGAGYSEIAKIITSR